MTLIKVTVIGTELIGQAPQFHNFRTYQNCQYPEPPSHSHPQTNPQRINILSISSFSLPQVKIS